MGRMLGGRDDMVEVEKRGKMGKEEDTISSVSIVKDITS